MTDHRLRKLLGATALALLLAGCGSGSSTMEDTAATESTTTTVSTSTSTVSGDCEQASHFLDVSDQDNYIDWNGDGLTNSEYYGKDLTPSVSVTCSDTQVTVTGNGLINFDFEGLGPGLVMAPEAYDLNVSFPRYPEKAASPTELPTLGIIAVTVSGIQIFGPNEAAMDGLADPYKHGILEYCGGHVMQYHLHVRPFCYFGYTTMGGASSLLPEGQPGVVIGYALDGFPILAPWECDDAECTSVHEVKNSYVYTGTGDYANENAWEVNVYQEGAGDLDRCNGGYRPDGTYAYYATDQFPYYLGCYSGTPDLSANGSAGAGPGGNGPPPAAL
ncbi:YHYH protein [Hahella sp. SMD15-11]|uniref:YHYH protein n=1 Tax=Thermohahella caldifontis TaxID=3142973 RepID=A0AB39UVM7_9GAMM